MWRCFKLDVNDQPFFRTPTSEVIGRSVLSGVDKITQEALSKYINLDNEYDADQIKSDWFHQIDCDVFISHTRDQKDLAISLAGWLSSTFRLKPFVDSSVWGHMDDLLRKIDEAECMNEDKKTFNYPLRNISTSHVHMMLMVSLAQMLDRCECVFLLSPPKTTSISKGIKNPSTHSPWLYSEIILAQLMRRRKPHSQMVLETHQYSDAVKKKMQFNYDLDLSHFKNLSEDNLQVWHAAALGNKKPPLDILYNLFKL